MKEKKSSIGIGNIKAPARKCEDKHCPFHGNLPVRGRSFTGKVISQKFHKTVKVEWDSIKFLPKYERYSKSRTRVKTHIPDCMDIGIGDMVTIIECRPISKTKHFVIVEKAGK